MLKEDRVREILSEAGAVMDNDHFKYTSGKHGSAYVAKDKLCMHVRYLDELCMGLAERFSDEAMAGKEVEVVLAPAIGAIDIKTGVARVLDRWARGKREVLGVYAEHEVETVLSKSNQARTVSLSVDPMKFYQIEPGMEIVVKMPSFEVKRSYAEAVKGKRVLVVEDILTTGGSARETVLAVRKAGGQVVGVGAFVNRGGVTAADLDAERLETLLSIKLDAYDPAECPMCRDGMPFNRQFGHGK